MDFYWLQNRRLTRSAIDWFRLIILGKLFVKKLQRNLLMRCVFALIMERRWCLLFRRSRLMTRRHRDESARVGASEYLSQVNKCFLYNRSGRVTLIWFQSFSDFPRLAARSNARTNVDRTAGLHDQRNLDPQTKMHVGNASDDSAAVLAAGSPFGVFQSTWSEIQRVRANCKESKSSLLIPK